ncbi:MAG: excinuclease ABC subunit UvrC [Patescibacteria group bacterium]|nr:excinuclease ABC subunit UvrC [Patescibacteria group bacterium]
MKKSKPYKPEFSKIPESPGVYIMLSFKDKVLYVGKAVNLQSRVKSYWPKDASDFPKTKKLIEKIGKLDFIITTNEVEALVLENQLIKKHRPQFNVLLRDDKSYQYIKIDLNEKFPTITTVRQLPKTKKSNVKIFGPYTQGGSVKQIIKLIGKLFPLCGRANKLNRANTKMEPCLYHHMGKCLGPCVGDISSEKYKDIMTQVVDFLAGKDAKHLKALRTKMGELSEEMKFEEAMKIRDQLKAVDAVFEKQDVSKPNQLLSQDFWGWSVRSSQALISILQVRRGQLMGKQLFVVDINEVDETEMLGEALREVYSRIAGNYPKEVVLPQKVASKEVFEAWLAELAGHKVAINVATKGPKYQLSLLAARNAAEHSHFKNQVSGMVEEGLGELKKLLQLKKLDRIEGYDISHLGGSHTVASMVVFTKGKPNKSQYRRFKIKTVRGIDDYQSLGEVLERRLKPKNKKDSRFAASMPDLILIDGGKGQLNTVLRRTDHMDLGKTKIISLAKQQEEIFVPDIRDSVKLDKNNPALQLLQQVRDEAHRFAITYQTHLRTKTLTTSARIPGIGPTTKKKLVKEFGSLMAAKDASIGKLRKVIGKKADIFKQGGLS